MRDSQATGPQSARGHLPRLMPEWYRGHAAVHWNLTLKDRATGWLNGPFHAHFREVLLHAQIRYGLASPAYCLMPDHIHVLWLGLAPESDQTLAVRFLRAELNVMLDGRRLQKEAYDHVLREQERERNALRLTAHYILENPVRAGLVASASEYAFSGCQVQGYPRLCVHASAHWDLFWRIVGTMMR